MKFFVPDATSRFKALFCWSVLAIFGFAALALGQVSGDLWSQYAQNPNAHPNIPNNSFAGYRRGEVPIPVAPIVNDVADFGGVGDGIFDNTAAFRAAIADAARKGGGAVGVGPGNWLVRGIIHLKSSGVVLRGAGRGNTVLSFNRSLREAVQTLDYVCPDSPNCSQWSWLGGHVWISPGDTFNSSGLLQSWDGSGASSSRGEWENWRSGGFRTGPRLANLSAPATRGDWSVTVDSASQLRAGQMVLMTWVVDKTNYSLWKHIAGHALMENFNWTGSTMLNSATKYRWPVEIASISGNVVTLKQPLRIDARSNWNVGFEPIGAYIQETGVEELTIREIGAPTSVPHHANPGFNAIFLNRAVNCWVRNVDIEGAENGILVRYAKNITATGFNIKGTVLMHHGTTSAGTNDALFSNFSLNSPVRHGISTEALAAGNVWSRGTLAHGTFDSHRVMPFDLLHTQITLFNDGEAGGGSTMGPHQGKNAVNWNVQTTGTSSKFVNQPDNISMGALVGMRGPAPDTSCAGGMICGNKGVVIADAGKTPAIPNLYEAQLGLRRDAAPWVQIVKPFDGSVRVPGTIYLKAIANAGNGKTVQSVEFWNGATKIGTSLAAPFTVNWLRVPVGTYNVTARARDNLGGVLVSSPVRIVVAN